jgi:hypothetical protein
MSVCAILAYLSSGFMVAHFGPVVIFRVLIGSSAVILLAGFFNWFGDTSKYHRGEAARHGKGGGRGKGGESALLRQGGDSASGSPVSGPEEGEGGLHPALGRCCWGLAEYDKAFVANHQSLFFLSAMISTCAMLLSIVMMCFRNWVVRLAVLAAVFILVAGSFFGVARRAGLPEVANAGLFIFLSNAVTPDIETAMFYWYTNAEEGPQFSPQFVGYISGLAFACMFAGNA